MKERHWISLVTSLRQCQCVLVLGQEIPGQSGKSFAETLVGALAKDLEEENRVVLGDSLPLVAQQCEDDKSFGPSSLRALTARYCISEAQSPSEIHRQLAKLPFSLALTTCYDDALSQALREVGRKPIVQRFHVRGDKLDNPEFEVTRDSETPVVYYLFGLPHEPNSLVVSENDLLDLLIGVVSQRPPLPNSLRSALKRPGQSFLFIGFGIKHWYIRVLQKVLIRALDLEGDVFANEPLRGLADYERKQTILFYERGNRIEIEDDDVTSFLMKLSERVKSEVGSTVWKATVSGPSPRVFVSYAREDSALATHVYNALKEHQFDPWIDSKSLQGGEEWDQRIRIELAAANFAIVLCTPILIRKRDSYVNKEIHLAVDRAMEVRGQFLIPLRTCEISGDDRIVELGRFQEMVLRKESFEEDMSALTSTMRREFQRRSR